MSLVELAKFPLGINAEIARGFLESHGIGSVVFDGGMNIAEAVPIMIPVRLMALEEDQKKALKLLEDADLL